MVIDIVCLIFLAYGFWVGYSRGIISTVLSLVSYIFGVLAAMKFGPIAGDMIFDAFPAVTSAGGFIIGVVLLFFLTLILFRILARGLTGFMESVNINFINQVLGGLLSGLFFTFIFSGLVYFGDRSKIITDEVKADSITYPVLIQLPDIVIERGKALFPIFYDFYEQAVNAMDRLKDNVERGESDSIFDLEE
ncbi:membrane protein required for colicin V production [Lewinella aquimaris]|uniref:Membrane protein required for colicin V production n=1 Tax=Neolewinella aquimaris TaxID=1835722 RepID=A0A840E3K0_9BACT|nr:CvpA family protein [Neolewinella aquimaris]MBB4079660.1 membrane protein required for colicin V production [Neolewinella aquimaris]